MSNEEPTSELDEKRLRARMITLTWPAALQSAAGSIFAMIIIYFVGRLGPEAITAVGLSETIIALPIIAVSGLAVAVRAIVARHVGAGEDSRANTMVRQSMLLALILGIFFAVVLWFSADVLLWIFRARPEVVELSRDYIRVNAPATIAVFLATCGVAILHGLGDTRTPMIIAIIMEIIGVSLSYVLITGFGGAPALGVSGAAISRAVVSTVTALIVLATLAKGRGAVKYDIRTAWVFNWADTKRILKVGLPAFGDQLATQGAYNTYTIIISGLGTTAFAAHALAMRILGFTYVPLNGLSMAATILVGQSLGTKKPDLAKRSGYLALRYCVAVMACVGLITFVFARQLIGMFTVDPAVMHIGALGLQIWALAMVAVAVNFTLASGLRGAGDTRRVFLINTAVMWIIRVGVGALLVFAFNLGVVGAWLSAVSDQAIRAVLMWRRFAGGKWQSIEV